MNRAVPVCVRSLWKRTWPGLSLVFLEALICGSWACIAARAAGVADLGAPLAAFLILRLFPRWRGGMYASHVWRPARLEWEHAIYTELIALGGVVLFFAATGNAPALGHVVPSDRLQVWLVGWFAGWVVLLGGLVAGYRFFLGRLRARWVNVLRVVVVGSGPRAKRFVAWHDRHLRSGYRVIGIVRTTPIQREDCFGYNVLGTVEQLSPQTLATWLAGETVDVVVLAVPPNQERQILQALRGLSGVRLVTASAICSVE